MKAYKIHPTRWKRYESHYTIPVEKCLIVPIRSLGNEVMCDIRWTDMNGESQLLRDKMFLYDNLVVIDPMLDYELYEIYVQYYVKSIV